MIVRRGDEADASVERTSVAGRSGSRYQTFPNILPQHPDS